MINIKHCEKSHECPYGNAFEKDLCAYKKDLHEYDLCPIILKNWDYIIDELTKERKGDNNGNV